MIDSAFGISLGELVAATQQAGDAILAIYAQDFEVELKGDNSPLTEADRAANAVLMAFLSSHHPDIPVISEETKAASYSERSQWKQFWLVDPLDGTKEFIKKNGEFTVNVALIREGVPILGVVYRPTTGVLYLGAVGEGAWRVESDGSAAKLAPQPHYRDLSRIRVVASRSHLTPETLQFVENLQTAGKEVEFLSAGSSLKICLVAEGKADVYPRFGPTMEWDTAAAHAVALAAGRQVNQAATGDPLVYNKENLLNPHFIVE